MLKSALQKDQNYFEARFQLAKAYTAAGRFDQAESEFQKLMKMDPSRADLQLELARVDIFDGKGDDAFKEINQYLASHPETAETFELQGGAYALKNQYNEAEHAFQQALAKEPDRVSAKQGLAGVYIAQSRLQEARALLNDILSKDSKDVKTYYMVAQLEMMSKNIDGAIQAYNSILQINPSDLNARYRLGLMFIDKKDLAGAGNVAEELGKRAPKSGLGNTIKGLVYFERKSYRDALAELEKGLTKQTNLIAIYFLGLSHYMLGENELALTQFQKALNYNPSFVQARLLSAIVLLSQNRFDNVIEELNKVLEKDPENAVAYSLLGSVYIAKGSNDEGMKDLDKAVSLDPRLVDAYMKKGVVSLELGNQKSAKASLRTAVKVAPDVLNARLLLASYYVRQKNYDAAVNVLKEGLSGGKTDAIIYNYIALDLIRANRSSEALPYFNKAKGANPDFAVPYFNLATYYGAKGEYGKAIEEYNGLLARNPKNAEALVAIASLYEKQGNDKNAFYYYEKAKETHSQAAFFAFADYYARKNNTAKAQDTLDELLKMNPHSPEALEAKGKLLIFMKKYKEASSVFAQLEADNSDRGLPLLVNTYVMMKDYASALKKLQSRSVEHPERMDLKAEMARVYAIAGDQAKAAAEANDIIRARPNSAYGYVILATAYNSQGKIEDAVDTLKKGLQVDGKNEAASMMLGDLYAGKKDYALALKTFDGVLRINPRNIGALFSEGSLYDMLNRKKDAAKRYREVLGISENYVPALNNLAYLYLEGNGNRKEALELASRAYRLSPNSGNIMDTLGQALLVNGMRDNAVKMLKSAAAQMPGNPSVHYHLALALKETGDKAAAMENLQSALKLGNFPESKEASRLLSQLSRGK